MATKCVGSRWAECCEEKRKGDKSKVNLSVGGGKYVDLLKNNSSHFCVCMK
jgi:hypothetical protein